jgi:hypothetical protein
MTLRTPLAGLILTAVTLFGPAFCIGQETMAEFNKSVDQAVGDHVKVQEMLTDLQRAVSKHDSAKVASMVHYPIKVNPGNRPFTVKDSKAFVKDYDRIVTQDIAEAIYNQKYEKLFVNSEGAMIGDGEVWISGFCLDKNCKQSDIKIGTIQDTKNTKP